MGGGIAIGLMLLILVVAAGIAIAMYLGGGALSLSKERAEKDGARKRFGRPQHKRVSSETIENTDVVGTRDTRDR